jgi:hypothetical protein
VIDSAAELHVFNANVVGLKNEGQVISHGQLEVENANVVAIQNLGRFSNIAGVILIHNGGFTSILNQNDTFLNVAGSVIFIDSASGGIINQNLGLAPTFFGNLDHGVIHFGASPVNSSINVENSTFLNGLCAFIETANRHIELDGGHFENDGLVNVLADTFINMSGVFDNNEGYLFDPNNVMNCPGLGGTCLDQHLSPPEFFNDNDGDGTPFCEGDVDDLVFCPAPLIVMDTADSGDSTLRGLVGMACPGDTIFFGVETHGRNIHLNAPVITFNKKLTIIGAGPDNTIIDGSADEFSHLFELVSNDTVELRNLAIQYGGGDSIFTAGGAINVDSGVLKLVNCIFRHNTGHTGGALFSWAKVEAYNCVFYDNRALFASGVFENQGIATFVNCLFHHNQSFDGGGAIWNYGELNIVNSTLVNNASTDLAGGGIYNNGTLNLFNSIVWGNTAPFRGPDIDGSGIQNAHHNLIGDPADTNIPIGVNGNFSADPLFLNPLTRDYYLLTGSPAINSGLVDHIPSDYCDVDNDGNRLETIDIDLEGNPRVLGVDTDLGVFESGDTSGCRGFLAVNLDTIASDTFWSSSILEVSGSLTSGGIVSVVAGSSVTLGAGTYISIGNEFTAEPGACPKSPGASSPLMAKAGQYESLATPNNNHDDTALRLITDPSNNEITISFYLSEPDKINLSLTGLLGKKIMTLFSGEMDTGWQEVECSVDGIPEGIYLIDFNSSKGIHSCNILKLNQVGVK